MKDDYYYVNSCGELQNNTWEAIKSGFKTEQKAWHDYKGRLIEEKYHLIQEVTRNNIKIKEVNKKLDSL